MPNVTRSRESCRTSFCETARSRRSAAAARRGQGWAGASVATSFPARRDDEHVFQARVRALDGGLDAMPAEQRAQLVAGLAHAAIGEHPQPDAELRDAVDPG